MEHVISTADNNLTLSMYKEGDFRLRNKPYKENGTFKKIRALKGKINGSEEGIFTTESGQVYLVFTDWSISRPTDIEKEIINEALKATETR